MSNEKTPWWDFVRYENISCSQSHQKLFLENNKHEQEGRKTFVAKSQNVSTKLQHYAIQWKYSLEKFQFSFLKMKKYNELSRKLISMETRVAPSLAFN